MGNKQSYDVQKSSDNVETYGTKGEIRKVEDRTVLRDCHNTSSTHQEEVPKEPAHIHEASVDVHVSDPYATDDQSTLAPPAPAVVSEVTVILDGGNEYEEEELPDTVTHVLKRTPPPKETPLDKEPAVSCYDN